MNELSLVRSRYDRIAPFCDAMGAIIEPLMGPSRRRLWREVGAGDVLEVVGAARSAAYWPAGQVTGIDISPRMLERAHARLARADKTAKLELADVQAPPFPDASFDFVVTTCVSCSVPDAALGLREIKRVLKQGGTLAMLEHVASKRPILRWIMQRRDLLLLRLWGAHIARDTVDYSTQHRLFERAR